MIKLVITDLDDTLYSWIGFFVPAFYEMAEEVAKILEISQEELLKEYRLVHQKQGSVEFPRATLLLTSVQEKYKNLPKEEQIKKFDSAFHKFNSKRKALLTLYPGVKEFLKFLKKQNVGIVGYTESAEENGYYRLQKLGVDNYFKKIYVSDSMYQRPKYITKSPKTYIVHGKKPNPELIRQICYEESVNLEDILYIGDSLSKDILMAKQAGVLSAWVNINNTGQELYEKLVKISHWTEKDFEQERINKQIWQEKGYEPDYIIHSFYELQDIIENN